MLVGLGGMFYNFAFAPLLLSALALRHVKKPRWILDIALTVFVTWLIVCVYRLFIQVPVNTARANARGDFTYDDVGGNVATILIVAWLFPLIECGIVRLAFGVIAELQKRSRTQSVLLRRSA